MARNAGTQPRNRSSSLSAAWSFFWKSKNSNNNNGGGGNGSGSNGAATSSSSNNNGISNNNSNEHGGQDLTSGGDIGIGHRHSSTIHEEEDEEDRALVKGVTRRVLPQRRATTVGLGAGSGTTTTSAGQQQQHHYLSQALPPSSSSSPQPSIASSTTTFSSCAPPRVPQQRASLDQHRSSSISASWVASYAPSYPSTALSYPILEDIAVKGEIKNVDSSKVVVDIAQHNEGAADASQTTNQDPIGAKNFGFPSHQLSPGLQHSQQIIQLHTAPTQGRAYFDISPTVSSSGPNRATPHHGAARNGSSSRHGGIAVAPSSSQLSRRSDSHSQSSALTAFIDDKDVELDENSFFIHLRRMQERAAAQHEPGWLRTQHAILQAKHRIPLGSFSSSPSPSLSHSEYTRDGGFSNTSASRRTSLIPGGSSANSSFSQPFLSMFQSSSEQQHQQQQHQHDPSTRSFSHSHSSKLARQQPVLPFNCFQPNHVICVPREKSLGGLIFHKSFVDTHVLTPSPYFQGQFLTLDGKVVEIDRDVVRTISGFAHPRAVQILAEETMYDSNSTRPSRVLILERPLEGDGQVLQAQPGFDGILLPPIRHFNGDLVFLQSFPELSRALRDFDSLCSEFEKTYVYIRGFASYALDKLRLIYDKTRRDCLEDSVKLQRLVKQGSQADQDVFSELIENIVLGKLYNKIYHQSLLPIYGSKDDELDTIIAAYHQYFFSPGVHRGLIGGLNLAASEGKHLQQTLRKLGLSEELKSLKVEQALEPAAAVMRCWDAYISETDATSNNSHVTNLHANPLDQDAKDAESIKKAYQQERMERDQRIKRQQQQPPLRDGLRRNTTGGFHETGSSTDGKSRLSSETEQSSEGRRSILTPVEKACSLKQMLDLIALGAEDHLLDRSGFGFARKKRSDVSVTTDDLIPLLTLTIILAKPVNLSTNIFYIQRFRINDPRSEWSFSLVTLEACVEFLKTDPLQILSQRTNSMTLDSAAMMHHHHSSSLQLDSGSSSTSYSGSMSQDWPALVPWGEPSETGWGFSPPKCSSGSLPQTPAAADIPDPHSLLPTSMDTIAARTPLTNIPKDHDSSAATAAVMALDHRHRHSRSISMSDDDRFNGGRQETSEGSNSGQGSPFLRGVRLSSGSSSVSSLGYPRANSHRSPLSQQHSPHYHHHRITVDQGNDSPFGRSTVVPLQPSSTTMGGHGSSHLVVKPQIVLPAPKTPPVGSQKTQQQSGRMRSRPMSMVVPGSSPLIHSYASSPGSGGSALLHTRQNSQASSSNQSSPATSPKLCAPRLGSSSSNGSHSSVRRPINTSSNSLTTAPLPVLRANSMNSAMAVQATAAEVEDVTSVSPKQDVKPNHEPLQQGQQHDSPPLGNALLPSPPASASASLTKATRRTSPVRPSVKTSPSRTTTSISTPNTPSIFTPASSPVLRDALGSGGSVGMGTNGIVSTLQQHIQPASLSSSSSLSSPKSVDEASSPTLANDAQDHSSLSSTSDTSSNGRQQQLQQQPHTLSSKSNAEKVSPERLTLALISPPPSQPSTAFCKENVVVAAGLSPTDAEPSGENSTPSPATLTLTTPTGTTSTAELSSLFLGLGVHHIQDHRSSPPSKPTRTMTQSSSLSHLVLPPTTLSSLAMSDDDLPLSGWGGAKIIQKAASSPVSPSTERQPHFPPLNTVIPSTSSTLRSPTCTTSHPQDTLDASPALLASHGTNGSVLAPHVLSQSPGVTHATLAPSAMSEEMSAPSSSLSLSSSSLSTTPKEIRQDGSCAETVEWPSVTAGDDCSSTNNTTGSKSSRARSKALALDRPKLKSSSSHTLYSTSIGGVGGGRHQAPEIIALPSPLFGDIVHRKGDTATGGGGGGSISGSYTASSHHNGLPYSSSMNSCSPSWAMMTHAMRRDSGSGGAAYPSRRSFESPVLPSGDSSILAGPPSLSSASSLQHFHHLSLHHQQQSSSGLLSTNAIAGGFESGSYTGVGSRSPCDRRPPATMSSNSPSRQHLQQQQYYQPPGSLSSLSRRGSESVHPFALSAEHEHEQQQPSVLGHQSSKSMQSHLDGLGIRTESPVPMLEEDEPERLERTQPTAERWGGGARDGLGQRYKIVSGKYAGQHGGSSSSDENGDISPTTTAAALGLERLLAEKEDSLLNNHIEQSRNSSGARQSRLREKTTTPPPPTSLSSTGMSHPPTPTTVAPTTTVTSYSPLPLDKSTAAIRRPIIFHHHPHCSSSSSSPRMGPMESSSSVSALARGSWNRTSTSSVNSLNIQDQQQHASSRRSSATNLLPLAAAALQVERPSTPSSSQLLEHQQQQQLKTRLMLGDFLSELANAKDGDIVVGSGPERMYRRQ